MMFVITNWLIFWSQNNLNVFINFKINSNDFPMISLLIICEIMFSQPSK